MSESSAKKPQLKDYLSVYFYLKDLYNFRKLTEDSFSYETWAHELGFQHRSFLRQVVIGRRALTESTAKTICDRLFFTPNEQEHFLTLFRYSRSRTQQERELFGQKLMQILKNNYLQTELQVSTAFLSSPLFPRLQVLLSLSDKPKSLMELATALHVDPLDIEKGLLILTDLKLAEKNADGYKATVNSFKVPSDLGSEVLLDYHATTLQDAIAARHLPHHLRRYKSLILAMSQEEYDQFLKNMDAFVKEQLHKFDTPGAEGRRLFQVNFNSFSVSKELA